MSIISWNCRGLGNLRTVQEVAELVFSKKPDFVFLMETKGARDKAEVLRVKIGFEGLFAVDSVGASGGLALLWRSNRSVNLISYSRFHVDVMGYPFTWERGRGTENWVEERLDRAVSTCEWRVLHPHACVINQPMRTSDHSALFLCLTKPCTPRRMKQFQFENAWLRDDGYKDVIKEAWNSSSTLSLQDRLGYCGKKLMAWGGDKMHKFGKQIKHLKAKVERFRGCRSATGLREFNRLDGELSKLLEQEDIYWRQRAKQHWLRSADANTKYFHQYASYRRKKNHIARLQDEYVWERSSFRVANRSATSSFSDWVQLVFQTATSSLVGAGGVIFSSSKEFQAAFTRRLWCPQDPLLAEAMAYRETLSWLKSLGVQVAVIFSDCFRVVEAINDSGVSDCASYFGSLIDDCKALMASFESVLVSHVRRNLNVVAHTLARRVETQTGD
ncbi:unnamed protein product [Cuscuta campestris]|uniref:Uncharacterized protein n=1 Tax=Cuscuta campestris TaxID=132261 RepID=A0A484M9C5_9ASTE|nr:unnamed protein product [Cuscuta campestris]